MNRTKYPIASASFHRSEQCRPCLPAGKRMMWNFASRRGLFPRHVFLYERAASSQIAEFRFSRRSRHHIWLHQKMSMWWPKTTTTRQCLLRRITDASLRAGWTNFQDNKTLRSHAFNSHRYDTINIRPTFLVDLETTRFRGWCVSMEKRALVRRFRYMQTPL